MAINNFTKLLKVYKQLPKDQRGSAFEALVGLEAKNREISFKEKELNNQTELKKIDQVIEQNKVNVIEKKIAFEELTQNKIGQ